mmetsp:Transcript_170189/g.413729  ORF Transcript_170189/g.413729 Transcript_170189/m.413729 type:complete len:217 (-) Transcript_170189:229-879(-)
MKNVSCASRAGCICGWISVSKFQNPDSTKLFVGISANPSCRNVSRNCCLTFSSGWTCPPFGGAPAPGTRLYALKSASLQDPLMIISCVRSACAFFRSNANAAPLEMTYVFHASSLTSLRFLIRTSSSFCGTPHAAPFSWTAARCSRATSSTAAAFRSTLGSAPFSALTIPTHRHCIACLNPTSPTAASTLALNSASVHPSAGIAAYACASGVPRSR